MAKRTRRAKSVTKIARNKKVPSVNQHVTHLIVVLSKATGISKDEVRKAFNPLGRAMTQVALASELLEKEIGVLNRYLNHQLNQCLIDEYPPDRIKAISDMAEGGMIAYREYAKVGLETWIQHSEQALEEFADMLELGPDQPR